MVACALINKKGKIYLLEIATFSGEDNESLDDSDQGDDWNVNNSGRNSNRSFSSESFSEEEKDQDKNAGDQQYEGGESSENEDEFNDDDDDDDDDLFSS